MPTDQDAAARETLELLLQASARLDRMDATATTITLTRAALALQAIPASSTNGGVAIALMQAALVLLDRDGRRDAACRLQAALDTAQSLKRMAPDEEVSIEMIDAMLPVSRAAD